MCRAKGCDICPPGVPHHCRVCGLNDVTHRSANCPTKLLPSSFRVLTNVKLCRVEGCDKCKPGQTHYCRVCRIQDVTHRSANCPEKNKPIQSQLCVEIKPKSSKSRTTQDLSVFQGIRSSTVTVFKRVNGELWVLVGQRGVPDSWYKKICTFGGGVDRGESAIDAGLREAWEEGGIRINRSDLQLYKAHNQFANYYCVYDREPTVLGPRSGFESEIYKPTSSDSFSLKKEFGARSIRDSSGHRTGLFWVKLDDILSSTSDFVANSPSTRILRYMRRDRII